MTLKDLRKQKRLTQAACAKYLGIPLRTYQNYETDASKVDSMKYAFMLQKLEVYGFVDETHGILKKEQIKDICIAVFEKYEIEYCYLFGSYARGEATPSSDVDLRVDKGNLRGLFALGALYADLEDGLGKKLDLLTTGSLDQSFLRSIADEEVLLYAS